MENTADLYLPNFPREKVAELRGSLDYPPVGSPGAATRSEGCGCMALVHRPFPQPVDSLTITSLNEALNKLVREDKEK